MNGLQLEEKLDFAAYMNAGAFQATFIHPDQVSIDDKIKFESLFDFPEGVKREEVYVY